MKNTQSPNHKIGLILCGGGGKGAYQIGVWKALREYGYESQIAGLSGASVGALNSALFAQGDWNNAEDVWLQVTQSDFLHIKDKARLLAQTTSGILNIPLFYATPFFNRLILNLAALLMKFSVKLLSISKSSPTLEAQKTKLSAYHVAVYLMAYIFRTTIFTQDRLKEILMQQIHFSHETIKKYDVFSSVTVLNPVSKPILDTEYITWAGKSEQEIIQLILTSAALPVVYPYEEKDNVIFFDGGAIDTIPIKPLYDLGYRSFIVIPLANQTDKRFHRHWEQMKQMYPDCRFLRINPSSTFGGGLLDTLTVNQRVTEQRIQAGYEDGSMVLKREGPSFFHQG